MKKRVLIIHGPNINLLGEREPGIYGSESIEQINKDIVLAAEDLNIQTEIFQSNIEGEIINKLHEGRTLFDAVVLNVGALTHYSYAIRDAIAAVRIPCFEVHLSNIYAREDFRKVNVIAPVCCGSICGLGKQGYILALHAIAKYK